ncbi:segregation/condensation protein A [Candidatus Woesearchaeota archaeon]|nr:segregation/condensation protein A [Candidatus Woesearchaeota archaeon]
MAMQNQIHDIVFNSDDVTWQSMLYDLVKQSNMNPWDINITELADRYLELLQTFKKMDFRISGKVVLAAAILLKLKSTRLLSEDMSEFDALIASGQESQMDSDSFYDDLGHENFQQNDETPGLMPRTPQPRKRKVSIYDLVGALQQALEVKNRRVLRHRSYEAAMIRLPQKKVDINALIEKIYAKVSAHFRLKDSLTFDELVQSDRKDDKLYTFIPLLHLSHVDHRKIDLSQDRQFGPINISLIKPGTS